MKKNWIVRLLILALALMMVSFTAIAEEAIEELPIGYVPARGISMPFTDEDVAAGMSATFMMGGNDDFPVLPLLYLSYGDMEAMTAVMEKYADADMEDEEVVFELLIEAFSCNYTLYEIALFETETLNELMAAGKTMDEVLGLTEYEVIAENDGYTYVCIDSVTGITFEDVELQERVLKASARAKELLAQATYMPVVFAEGELTVVPDLFPTFESTDLNGNTVTNELFMGKDLTVINIWGTYCNPCIEEMPELAEWSASMPENVQLIGLVSDLYTMDDAETLELAKAICEATGADAYTHFIASEDLTELLSGVVGVPTTLFVDGNGALVGEPIVGANVSGCKKAVEDLLSTL